MSRGRFYISIYKLDESFALPKNSVFSTDSNLFQPKLTGNLPGNLYDRGERPEEHSRLYS